MDDEDDDDGDEMTVQQELDEAYYQLEEAGRAGLKLFEANERLQLR